MVDVASGRVWSVAGPAATGLQINVNPVWSADGKQITFTAFNPLNPVIGGTIHYWSVQAGDVNGVRPSVVQVASPVTHAVAAGGW
jgi:Tol biopolymer transport system component